MLRPSVILLLALIFLSPIFLSNSGLVQGTPIACTVESTRAKLHDLMGVIGSSIMSVCSLMFPLVAVFTVIDGARTGIFNWMHAVVLLVASCVTVAAGVDGAYPIPRVLRRNFVMAKSS